MEASALVAAVLLLSSTLAASVLRVPVGQAGGGAADGHGLRVRARRRRLHVHPAGRRLLQPKHRRLPLLLGRQQLLPEQQGQGRHLRLRRRRHHLHHRPKFLGLHFPFKRQRCWDGDDGHHNGGRRDDGGQHLEPWRGQHRLQQHEHGDGRQPGTEHHGRRRGRLPALRRSAGRFPRRHHPIIRPSPALALHRLRPLFPVHRSRDRKIGCGLVGGVPSSPHLTPLPPLVVAPVVGVCSCAFVFSCMDPAGWCSRMTVPFLQTTVTIVFRVLFFYLQELLLAMVFSLISPL